MLAFPKDMDPALSYRSNLSHALIVIDSRGRDRLVPSVSRIVLAITVAFTAAACDSGHGNTGNAGQATGKPTGSQSPSPVFSSPPPQPWVALDTDYAHDETFCAQRPLTGKINYVVRGKRVTLRFAVGGLPPRSVIAVNWINSPARGYVIAFVRSTRRGTARQSTLRIFRGGEVYGQGLQLQNSKFKPIGELKPC